MTPENIADSIVHLHEMIIKTSDAMPGYLDSADDEPPVVDMLSTCKNLFWHPRACFDRYYSEVRTILRLVHSFDEGISHGSQSSCGFTPVWWALYGNLLAFIACVALITKPASLDITVIANRVLLKTKDQHVIAIRKEQYKLQSALEHKLAELRITKSQK